MSPVARVLRVASYCSRKGDKLYGFIFSFLRLLFTHGTVHVEFHFHFLPLIPVSFSFLSSNFNWFSAFDFLFVSAFHFQLQFHFQFLFVDSFSFVLMEGWISSVVFSWGLSIALFEVLFLISNSDQFFPFTYYSVLLLILIHACLMLD